MEDLIKVIAALKCCIGNESCESGCPYYNPMSIDDFSSCEEMKRDALRILEDFRNAKISGRCW